MILVTSGEHEGQKTLLSDLLLKVLLWLVTPHSLIVRKKKKKTSK